MKFVNFLRTPVLKNICERLFLKGLLSDKSVILLIFHSNIFKYRVSGLLLYLFRQLDWFDSNYNQLNSLFVINQWAVEIHLLLRLILN